VEAAPGTLPNVVPGRQISSVERRLTALVRRQHQAEMHQLVVTSGRALALMTVAAIALGWVVAGRILRPLRTITAGARNISATNLHERLALAGPHDELRELGDTFDELISRLERAFHAQRGFVANASHELRTPLARQRTVAQVALADPDATVDSLRAAHERVLVTGAEQERLIDALLTLSRGQAGLERHEPFDLGTVALDVLEPRRTDLRRSGLIVDEQLAAAPTFGDARLAEILVANLVDNAARHNVPAGLVRVATTVREAHAVVTVTNDGPVVPPTELDRLLQPFQRLDPRRAGNARGLGLGLSIVEAIASAHGADLTVTARPSGGLIVEVAFSR
jgi:signal transduction histidine kinase